MRKLLSFLLTLIILFCAGCSHAPSNDPISDIPSKDEPIKDNPQTSTTELISTNELDSDLFSYLENDCSYSEKNYIFSPLSFKYAITLASYGANDATREELLNAMKFSSIDDNLSWASNFNNLVNEFNNRAEEDFKILSKYDKTLSKPNRRLVVANSVWHNLDSEGKIKNSYVEYINQSFNGDAFNLKGDELTPKINEWVNEKTNGLIPSLFQQPLTDKNTILINSLYLKAPWAYKFLEYNTEKKKFNGITETKEIDFMNTVEDFKFYKDNDSTLVILPLEGGINCALIMGDSKNVFDEIDKTKYQYTNLYIPKFEIETTFNDGELVDFLKKNGVKLAFDEEKSDFSNLIDGTDIFIDNIVQKAKIITDEEGIEAAAVTAITFDNAAAITPKEPVTICFDKPFKFFIYTEESQEILFFGNFCNP